MLNLKKKEQLKEAYELINPLPDECQNNLGIIGSYLYSNEYHDIDFVCCDIKTGYLLKQEAKKQSKKVQVIPCSIDEFQNIQNLLTFWNTSVVYKFGIGYIKGEHYDDANKSNTLEFNNNSLKKFKNSTIISKEIEKMKKRGYTI